MKENYYFLFGEGPVNAFNEGGLEDVLLEIQRGKDFATMHYNIYDHTPSDLLDEYSGFYDWVELDKLEYDTLQKSISEL